VLEPKTSHKEKTTMKTQQQLSKTQQIIDHLRQFPQDEYKEIATLYGVSCGLVSQIARKTLHLPNRRTGKVQDPNVPMPQIDTTAQIAAELEERRRRVTEETRSIEEKNRRVVEENRRIAELEEKLNAAQFLYETDADTGMLTIRQGTTEVTAHYGFWFRFLKNGEPAKARAVMTEVFFRRKEVA
jgi:hypothetical protein